MGPTNLLLIFALCGDIGMGAEATLTSGILFASYKFYPNWVLRTGYILYTVPSLLGAPDEAHGIVLSLFHYWSCFSFSPPWNCCLGPRVVFRPFLGLAICEVYYVKPLYESGWHFHYAPRAGLSFMGTSDTTTGCISVTVTPELYIMLGGNPFAPDEHRPLMAIPFGLGLNFWFGTPKNLQNEKKP